MIATREPELISVTEQPLTIGERFRANVRRLMAEQNLSQAGLAERLTKLGDETTAYNVAQLVTSKSFPSAKWIELLSRAFDVSEAELIQENFLS